MNSEPTLEDFKAFVREILRVNNETPQTQWIVAGAAKLLPEEPRTIYTHDEHDAALARQVVGPETAKDSARRFKAERQ